VTCSSRSSRLGVAVDEERTRGPVFSVVLGDRAGPRARAEEDATAAPFPLGADPLPTCRRGGRWWQAASRDRRAARPRSTVTWGPLRRTGTARGPTETPASPGRGGAALRGRRVGSSRGPIDPCPFSAASFAPCDARSALSGNVAGTGSTSLPLRASWGRRRIRSAALEAGGQGGDADRVALRPLAARPSRCLGHRPAGRRGERPPLAPAALEDALPSGPSPRAARLRVRLDRGARRTATRKFARAPRGARGAGDVALLLVELRVRIGERRRAREDPGRKIGTSNRRPRPTDLASRGRSARPRQHG
jgi:hypothetical protein